MHESAIGSSNADNPARAHDGADERPKSTAYTIRSAVSVVHEVRHWMQQASPESLEFKVGSPRGEYPPNGVHIAE